MKFAARCALVVASTAWSGLALSEDPLAFAARPGAEAREQGILDELSLAEAEVGNELHSHPRELRRTEALLEQAEYVARGGGHQKHERHVLERSEAAEAEMHHVASQFGWLVAEGRRVELDAGLAERAVDTAIGGSDPGTASRVASLLGKVRQLQRRVDRQDLQEAHAAERLSRGQHQVASGHTKAQDLVVAGMSTGEVIHRTALAELRLGQERKETLHAMKGVERKVAALFANTEESNAKKVEELLRTAERAEAKSARLESLAGRRDLQLEGQGLVGDLAGARRAKASMLEARSGAATVASLRARVTSTAERRLEIDEHLFSESGRIAGEVKHARRALGAAISDHALAGEVGGLLEQAQLAAEQATSGMGEEWVAAARSLEIANPEAAKRRAVELHVAFVGKDLQEAHDAERLSLGQHQVASGHTKAQDTVVAGMSTGEVIHRTALAELRLGQEGKETLHAMKGVERKVAALLANTVESKATKVEELLRTAERAEAKSARLAWLGGRRDLQLEHQGLVGDLAGARRAKASMLEARSGAATVASLRARVTSTAERRLDTDEHLFSESGRIAGEVKRARRALGAAISDRALAGEVGGLLEQAQLDAEQATAGMGEEWVAAARSLEIANPEAAKHRAAELHQQIEHASRRPA